MNECPVVTHKFSCGNTVTTKKLLAVSMHDYICSVSKKCACEYECVCVCVLGIQNLFFIVNIYCKTHARLKKSNSLLVVY